VILSDVVTCIGFLAGSSVEVLFVVKLSSLPPAALNLYPNNLIVYGQGPILRNPVSAEKFLDKFLFKSFRQDFTKRQYALTVMRQQLMIYQ
jgi:hypothetical protein